ncbi:hypothetical protein FRC06_010170, partial [Ceratobasidium sp. 370]
MPQVYDRVDAVVRLGTTNPFSASGRGMSQGEYCYTNELPQSENERGHKSDHEAHGSGVTVLPPFNPHSQDRDTDRRQRRRDGREDPPPAPSSRRRRDSLASPTPIRRRTRDTERFPTPARRQTYREPSPPSQPLYADHPDSDGEYQIPPAPRPVPRSSRLAKQAPPGRANTATRQPLPGLQYPEHSDEETYPVPSAPKAKSGSGLAPMRRVGGYNDARRRVSSGKKGTQVLAAEHPEQEQLSDDEVLTRGQDAHTDNEQVQPASITVFADVEPIAVTTSVPVAVSTNEKIANAEPPVERSNGYVSEPGQASQPSQRLWPPWYWPPFAPQPLPPNPTNHELCPACVEKSAPKVCENCHTTFNPGKPEPANTGPSNDQTTKPVGVYSLVCLETPMGESDVRELVKNELDRILRENRLVEGLAGRVADAIRPELPAMVEKFARDLAAALPALVPNQPPVSTPMLTLDPSPTAPSTATAPLTLRTASIPITPISPVPAHKSTPIITPVTEPASGPLPTREPEPVPTVANGPDPILDSVLESSVEPIPETPGPVTAPEPTPSVQDPQPLVVMADPAPAGAPAPA